MSYDTKLMVKIANLYYKDNLKQESIAMEESVRYYLLYLQQFCSSTASCMVLP